MIPETLIKRIPTIKEHNWKKVGGRESNSVLNRELYIKGFSKKYMEKMLGVDFGCNNFMFINPVLFLDIDEFNDFKKKFVNKINNEEGYYKTIVYKFREYCEKFEIFCNWLMPKEVVNISDKKLLSMFNAAIEQFLHLVPFVFINHNEEEIPNELLDNTLSKRQIAKEKSDLYKSELIIPLEEKTHSEKEKKDLLNIARIIKNQNYSIEKLPEELIQLINNHLKKYCWIKSKYFDVKEVTSEEILDRIRKYLDIDFEEQDIRENNKQKHEKERFNELIKELDITKKELGIITLLRELLFLKTYRKELISLFSYSIGRLTAEMARREGISHQEFINQTLDEISIYFKKGIVNREEIKARLNGFSHICINGNIYVIGGINYQPNEKNTAINEIKGVMGHKGYIKGRVKIIKNESELKYIEDSQIIVIDSLSPSGTQFIHNTKGIITNHGGVLSHAAIIARELGIPCMIGTQNATQIFDDGEYIELDADNGIARKLKDKYRRMFEITMGLCLADLYMRTHVFNIREHLGRGHRNIVFMIKDGKNTGYFSEEDIEEMGRAGIERLKNKEFISKNLSEARNKCEELYDFSEYINSIDLRYMNIKDILNQYNLLFNKIQTVYGYFNVSQPGISFALENEIKKELKEIGITGSRQQELLQELLFQEEITPVEEEELGLLNLAIEIRNDNTLKELFKNDVEYVLKELPRMSRKIENVRSFSNKLDLHVLRYSFLASYENFDLFHKKYYIDRIKQIIDVKENTLKEKIGKFFSNKKELEELRNSIFEENNIPEHMQHLINVIRTYSHQRMYIRTHFTKGISILKRFYDEFAYRMNLSSAESRYLMNEEINSYFLENKPINREEIANRMQLSIFRIKDDIPTLLAGREAEEFKNKYLPEEDLSNITELKGAIANKGYAKGKVKILHYGKNMAKQMEEMKKGDILIAGNTRPEVIVACQKASAIVTDEGGILSHASLVSRELGIPCIVGTYKATKVFKNGDMVEVDANTGVVRKI